MSSRTNFGRLLMKWTDIPRQLLVHRVYLENENGVLCTFQVNVSVCELVSMTAQMKSVGL